MKKIILCLVALLIALGLSACGKDLPSGNTPSAPDTSDVDNKVDVTDPDKDAPKGDGKDDADADKKDTPCDHKGLKYRVAKAATCTEAGSEEGQCANCGEVFTQEIVPAGHSFSKPTCTEGGACKNCGEAGEAALGHSLEFGVCTACGDSFRTAADVQDVIKVTGAQIYRIDSAGGVFIGIGFENTSDKVINYVYFTVTAYNAVGDPVKCEIKRKYDFKLEAVGPVQPNEKKYGFTEYGDYDPGFVWERVLYGETAKTVQISEIRIVFADNTEVKFEDQECEYALCEPETATDVADLYSSAHQLYVSGSDRRDEVRFALICGEGYRIKKFGTATLRVYAFEMGAQVGSVVKGALLSTQTFELDESVYETANEVWLNTDFSFVPAGKMQTFVIEAELAFDDGTSFTGEIMGYVRAGK